MAITKQTPLALDPARMPRHVAIIMDGNGRWAQKRGLPRSAGHKAGAESFRRLGTYCKELGIDYLTVYAFSTENWKRPPEEIDGIMQLLRRYLHECIDTMERDGNRLRFLGDLSVLDDDLKELIRETNEISARIEGFQANVCLNYGGRDEIVHAARAFARDCAAGEKRSDALTEERRKELVKQIRKYAEGGKVAIRNIRRDAMETFKKKQKASELTEDDLKIAEKDLQKLTDDMCKELDALLEKKEKELMEV